MWQNGGVTAFILECALEQLRGTQVSYRFDFMANLIPWRGRVPTTRKDLLSERLAPPLFKFQSRSFIPFIRFRSTAALHRISRVLTFDH